MTQQPITNELTNEVQSLHDKMDQVRREQREIRALIENGSQSNRSPERVGSNSPVAHPMSPDNIIPAPNPRVVNGKSQNKPNESDIMKLINPEGSITDDRVKAILGTFREFRKRTTSSIKEQLRNTEYVSKTWGDIPWQLVRDEVQVFEELVEQRTGVPLSRCAGNWASKHLLSMTWNNHSGHRRRTAAARPRSRYNCYRGRM